MPASPSRRSPPRPAHFLDGTRGGRRPGDALDVELVVDEEMVVERAPVGAARGRLGEAGDGGHALHTPPTFVGAFLRQVPRHAAYGVVEPPSRPPSRAEPASPPVPLCLRSSLPRPR